MVFMEDSERAIELAKAFNLDLGLHLNLTQRMIKPPNKPLFSDYHEQLIRYLTAHKYNFLIYNPALRNQFEYVFRIQYEEFERVYGAPPSHIDGHHHMHLCTNMLIGAVIPEGQKVRRNYSFSRGEKNFVNRMYRAIIDKSLRRRYITTDFLFSLLERLKIGRLAGALNLARSSNVELQTHPEREEEFRWLVGQASVQAFFGLQKGNFSQLKRSACRGGNPKNEKD